MKAPPNDEGRSSYSQPGSGQADPNWPRWPPQPVATKGCGWAERPPPPEPALFAETASTAAWPHKNKYTIAVHIHPTRWRVSDRSRLWSVLVLLVLMAQRLGHPPKGVASQPHGQSPQQDATGRLPAHLTESAGTVRFGRRGMRENQVSGDKCQQDVYGCPRRQPQPGNPLEPMLSPNMAGLGGDSRNSFLGLASDTACGSNGHAGGHTRRLTKSFA